jgi:membrane associated rhomboid family serine protease
VTELDLDRSITLPPMIRAQSSAAAESSTKPTPVSLFPPPGTLVLCLLTFGTALAQSIRGWAPVAQALGVAGTHARLSSWIGIRDGQAVPGWLTLITYVLPHGGWWHVLPNLAALWVFGAMAERGIGTWRFVAGYFASGAVGALCYPLVVPNATKPHAGASLAIAGIMGAYASWRWSSRRRPDSQRLLVLALEAVALAGVIAWLGLRSVPARPDLFSSVLYHFMPFLALWVGVQTHGEYRRIYQRVSSRVG